MSAAAPAPAAAPAAAAAAPAAAPAAPPAAEAAAAGAAAANPAPVQNSSLYVGDLDRDATEASLYELFSQVGPVASIRVCRDAVTRRSLGYAYVNYNSALDSAAAERALEALNYTVINGRPIRIMWSHRDPAFRRSGLGNIFIKNLDRSIDHKALHDTFSQFGNILSCKVATDAAGNSRGYGFVHFETEEAANLATEKVNGMQLQDKVVYVGPFQKRVERGDGEGGGPRFTNVYVKNLAEDCDDAALRALAEESGEVTSAVVMRDADGKSRGFGFVNFADPAGAAKCVEAVNGRERDGRVLFAGRAQKKAERESLLRQRFEEARNERVAKYQGLNLYVKNLPGDDGSGAAPFTDEDLRQEFAPFGTITSAKVMVDERDKSRGFGFVCYTSAEEATRAVTEMNGRMVRGKPLYVALAQRKEVRRAQLQQQLQQQRLAMAAAAGRAGPGAGGMPGMPPFPGAGAGGPAMFYPGGPAGMPGGPGGPMMGGPPRGMAGPGGLVYPGAMMAGPGGRGGFMGGRGGPRGGPGGMMMMGPGGPMGPMGPGGPMGGPMGGPGGFMPGPGGMVMGGRGAGRGGMGGRGGGRGGPYDMAGPDGGRGRGFGAAGAGGRRSTT